MELQYANKIDCVPSESFILFKQHKLLKQGWIHGNPVADGWVGAVMQKPLGIQKCDGPMDGPTN